MNSFRKIDANRRNAQRSTGPVTEEGKRMSRQNAVRHGLTAETVIDALEDAEDYAAFEMAVTADYDANRRSNENWCSGWQACCGGCVAPPQSRVDCSRSRLGICCNFGNSVGLIECDSSLPTASTDMPSRPKVTWEGRRTNPWMLAHHRYSPWLIRPMT